MPLLLARFAPGMSARGVIPFAGQGFVGGPTTNAIPLGNVGGVDWSIDGASNNGVGRQMSTSPNTDMLQEMRVESTNFTASIGHGTGVGISMMTRAGTNTPRGTLNYQTWTNKFNPPNQFQDAVFDANPRARSAYEDGASHNASMTFGGPVPDSRRHQRHQQAVHVRQLFLRARRFQREVGDQPDASEKRPRPQPPGRRLLGPAAAAQSRSVRDLRPVDDAAGSEPGGARHSRSVSEQQNSGRSHHKPAVQALHGIPAKPEPESGGVESAAASTTSTMPHSQTRSEATSTACASISTIRTRIDSSGGSAAATSRKARETGRTRARPACTRLSRVRKTSAGTGNWTRVQGDTVIDGQIGVNRFLETDQRLGMKESHTRRDRIARLHGRVLPESRRFRRSDIVPIASDQLRRHGQQLLPVLRRQLRDVRPGHALPGASEREPGSWVSHPSRRGRLPLARSLP